ncbi:MAG: DUF975 family protein [Oscillospiraceae bacterium]|nr:DUF975 family protein [Oscillospiraceae bacterium]
MFASDFRKWAREVLKGNWGTAICVSLIGSLLGGGIDLVSGQLGVAPVSEQTGTEAVGMIDLAAADAWPMMVAVTVVSMLIAFAIGGAITLGMSHYFTNLAAHRGAVLKDLFARFSIWLKGIWMLVVMGVFVALWSVLFIIPGIIALYRYSMVPYLIAEFPDLSVMDAVRESGRLMKGNKWRLFCLHMSFFGWALLVVLCTFGFGYLWLMPYMQAAEAAFYLEVTGRAQMRYVQPEA